MSRSNYNDDADNEWQVICWRGAVKSAMRGKRGQALLKEMLAALEALPERKLVDSELEHAGSYCALGAVGAKRGLLLSELDPDDADRVAAAFGIAPALAREIFFVNDEAGCWNETDEQRWARVHRWVKASIKEEEA